MCTFMNGYAAHAYHALVPGAAKADLLRYCLIYEYGGVYLDIKSGAKELHRLIYQQDTMVVSGWSHRHYSNQSFLTFFGINCKSLHVHGELQNWWIAAVPKHPVLEQVINKVVMMIEERIKTYHATLCMHYKLIILIMPYKPPGE